MKLIVVEGPDGCGKTTLIERLRRESLRHYLLICRSGPPDKSEQFFGGVAIYGLAAQQPVPVVVDRHPLISEPIYGPILRGHSVVHEMYGHRKIIENLCDDIDRVIYCRPPYEVIEQHVNSKPQLSGVIKHLSEIVAAYDVCMNKLERDGVKVLRYDWTDLFQGFDKVFPIDQLFFGDVE